LWARQHFRAHPRMLTQRIVTDSKNGGAVLKVFVNLVDQHGPDALITALVGGGNGVGGAELFQCVVITESN
jgi:hypothetical protein